MDANFEKLGLSADDYVGDPKAVVDVLVEHPQLMQRPLLVKGGKAVVGRTETGSLARAAPGQKPGGVAEREVTAVGDVVNVDAKAKKVSVKNAQGEVIDLPVQDPEQLKLVKKGDQVQVTYKHALAIALEPPAAAKKKPAEKK